jgi:hypothetical protein
MFNSILEILRDNNELNNIDVNLILDFIVKYDNPHVLKTINIFFRLQNKHHQYILKESNKCGFNPHVLNYYATRIDTNFYEFDIDINETFIEDIESFSQMLKLKVNISN